MVDEVELNRLREARELAYQHKEVTYQAKAVTQEYLTAARIAMDASYTTKRDARLVASTTLQAYQMLRAKSRRAPNKRSLANAASNAALRHDEAKRTSAKANKAHGDAKQAYLRAHTEYQSAKEAFLSAKADFEEANTAYHTRWQPVARAIAENAGVSPQYLDDVLVSPRRQGGYNIYFGGVDRPNGPNHGHYCVDASGVLTYKREPGEPHGPQNHLKRMGFARR